MNIKLRPCTLNDADILRKMSIETYYETFAPMNTSENMEAYLNRAFDMNKLRRELNDKNSFFFFLYSDDELAGYLKLNEAPSQTDLNDVDSMEIERIYVSGKFQGMGLGGYLMKHALRTASEKKKKYVWLGVWEKNEKALQFYKKKGFYKIGAHSFFMGDDKQTDYIMRRDLTAIQKI